MPRGGIRTQCRQYPHLCCIVDGPSDLCAAAAAIQTQGRLPKLHTHVTYTVELINGLIAVPAASRFTLKANVHPINLACKDAASQIVPHSGQSLAWPLVPPSPARLMCRLLQRTSL
jgi:hypothetical protein